MRKNICAGWIFLSGLLFLGCENSKEAVAAENPSSVQEKVISSEEIEISEAEVAATLNYLSSDELQGRKTGTAGIEKAAKFIENVFRENKIEPYYATYRDSFMVNGTTGYNLIGLKKGSDPKLKNEYIIIGAHYDHVGINKTESKDSIFNGANDNASGVTAVLEMAKYFADVDTKRSILFVLFSAEEMGLLGSEHLAKRLKKEELDLYLMLNLEMLGIPMEGKDYRAYLTGYDISNLAETINKYSGEKLLGSLPQAKTYNLFNRSDNATFFQEFHVPAQTISTFDFTNFEYYHHENDEAQLMNVPFMTELIEDLIPAISKIANSITREIKVSKWAEI
ncbi:MAG TPA: M20/M25/M40 family metallo-hydrolase [Salinimicrobium sp.]|nr:M20/M25/M40 family metallo-hydrolase [Salinimicrobium sp.]